jgi:hypothetical protein
MGPQLYVAKLFVKVEVNIKVEDDMVLGIAVYRKVDCDYCSKDDCSTKI